MPLSRLSQIALPVADADRSQRFYAEALGLPELFRFGDLADHELWMTFFRDPDGHQLALMEERR